MEARMTLGDVRALDDSRRHNYLASRLDRASEASESFGAFISIATNVSADDADGALSGVPFALKDNIDFSSLPTTAGTPALRDSHSRRNAPSVQTLSEHGALVVGKTNMHELAFGITSNNYAFGPVRNPHAPDRSAGGSSGGSAVAVAVGVVPFALGTDTGGSARIPAAHCGIVGYRPTTGRYSSEGVVKLSSTRDSVGLLANSVEDVRELHGLLDTAEPLGPSRDLSTARELRVGVPVSGFVDDLDLEVEEAFRSALRAIEAAGATLVDIDVSDLIALDAQCGFPIALYETPRELQHYLDSLPDDQRRLSFADLARNAASPDVVGLLALIADQPVSEDGYFTALAVRQEMIDAQRRILLDAEITLFAYPTVPMLPPPLGDDDETEVNGTKVPVFAASIRNTSPATLIGSPAISVPAGMSSGGLPIGLSLEGLPGDDRHLLAAAQRVEEALAPSAGGAAGVRLNRVQGTDRHG